ncbi:MAG: DUF2309 domain-containing protein [Bryobacterales bacterium]|nr:DUF2309 domain-containing protein [Bryobacterales bacterium]
MGSETATHSIEHIVRHAAHLLPAQGPIGVFVHHNTLHAFQHLPFEEGVLAAARTFGTEPYLDEEAYRAEMRQGRIQASDIDFVLAGEPNAVILAGRLDRNTLRRSWLVGDIPEFDAATLDWELEESRLSEEGIRKSFDVCLRRMGGSRHREADLMRASATLQRIDEVIHPWLIRLCGSYLDQGMAYWPMPSREDGFYRSVRDLLAPKGMLLPEGLRGLDEAFRKQAAAGWGAGQVVEEMLAELGCDESQWEHVVRRELLALAGWAGMFQQLEQQPALAPHVRLCCSVLDYLAVRLTLHVVARRNLREVEAATAAADEGRVAAARLGVVARELGLEAEDLESLPEAGFCRLADAVAQFDGLERRRLFHLAYERRHEQQVLGPLQRFRSAGQLAGAEGRPAAQVFFCIDDREESMRRHLEEVDPAVETFGAAGFFGVAIDYAGIDDPGAVSLCPIVVTPQHAVREKPAEGYREQHGRRKAARRFLAQVLHNGSVGSRSMVRGWLATATLGLFSLFPLIARILSPRVYGRLRDQINEILVPRVETELAFTRKGNETVDGLAHGFSVAEKAERVAGVLKGAGLVRNFARVVIVLGHGSTSINNPHESAYDCGACGGRRGGPNARLFAAMANQPEVRVELRRRGVEVPEDTWFVGGYHDTCSDGITLFDVQATPETHNADLARIHGSLDKARARNAHERGRRFEFWRGGSGEAALAHAEERSEHLAEPRPEYGHSTNAVCIVGRRASTRGLFLDRRAFLVSYDAGEDPTDEYLARQLGAVVPVCAGISLEYYFSRVDNERYGCGTKLPHNVAGLVGVMNGHASDLRTGLTWQMVEIHEPVRILFVIETTPERLLKVMQGNAAVREFVENRWIRVSTMDPASGRIHVYRDSVFEPLATEAEELPAVASSMDWYRGKRQHLPIARIGSLQEVA